MLSASLLRNARPLRMRSDDEMVTEVARAIARLGAASSCCGGAPADLIVCSADPSADIEAFGSLGAVVRDGHLFEAAALRDAAANDVAHRDRFFSRIASGVLARLAMHRLASAFTN